MIDTPHPGRAPDSHGTASGSGEQRSTPPSNNAGPASGSNSASQRGQLASRIVFEAELAHMNRLSITAASLAHELTQPIAAARNNAQAALNFLAKSPPDLAEVREALGCVVADADRAGDIIDRARDRIKKAYRRKVRFDLDAAIGEAIGLARGPIIKNRVSLSRPVSPRGCFRFRGIVFNCSRSC